MLDGEFCLRENLGHAELSPVEAPVAPLPPRATPKSVTFSMAINTVPKSSTQWRPPLPCGSR